MNTARRKGDSIVSGRPGGRPRRCEKPRVPYEEVDRLLVFGEIVATEDGKNTTMVYPSYRDLALRYGVSNSVIAAYAKKHNCLKRREVAQARIEAKADEKLVELRAEALALSRDDELRIIDTYLAGFEKALAGGTVRFDDPASFDRFCRLKEFLAGGADSRQEVHAALSLEDLQLKHRQMLRQVEESSAADRRTAEPALPAPGNTGLPGQFSPPAIPSSTASGKATGRLSGGAAEAEKPELAPRGPTAAPGARAGGWGPSPGAADAAPQSANVAPTRRSVGPEGHARGAAPDQEDEP